MEKRLRFHVRCWLALLGLALTAGCSPAQYQVFVANVHGHYVFGYEACERALEPIASFTLSEGDGEHPGPDRWRVRLAGGPPVREIELGVLPSGYVAELPYRPVTTKRFNFGITPVGHGRSEQGFATEFVGLSDGHVRWSGGTRRGRDLHDVTRSGWSC